MTTCEYIGQMALASPRTVSLGIDIGGTRIKTVALENGKDVLLERRIDSDAKYGPESVRKAVRSIIEYYRSEKIPFTRVGLGCAGSVNPQTGVVLNSPNFAAWKDVPLRDWVAEDAQVPVSVDNDANCAMYTEWRLGNALGTKNAVLLTFGTGVGGGLILNGQLYTGSTGSAAELGHFSIHADGVLCPCGNRGCFERYCSASALEKMLPGYTSKEIFMRAKEGEQPYLQIIEKFLIQLKVGVVSLANIFDPEVILIGGGLSKGLETYLPSIQEWIRGHAFPAVSQTTKVIPTKFANQSGAIGAALLSLEIK